MDNITNFLSMYDITRPQAAKLLWVSTRTIDRYVKSGKVRSKKEWKIVYIHKDDIANIWWETNTKQEVITVKTHIPEPKKEVPVSQVVQNEHTTEIDVRSNFTRTALDEVYKDLRTQIQEKDEKIQELSLRLWRAEEIAEQLVKTTVPVNDFKKSQFLLEESKEHLNKQIEEVQREREELKNKLHYEKRSNIFLIITVVVLLTVATMIWILQI